MQVWALTICDVGTENKEAKWSSQITKLMLENAENVRVQSSKTCAKQTIRNMHLDWFPQNKVTTMSPVRGSRLCHLTWCRLENICQTQSLSTMHMDCDFVHRPGIRRLFFSLALTNYDSQTSRPPSEEKQLLQWSGESRRNATKGAKRERHDTHTQSQRSETHTLNNWVQLVIIFH